MPFTAQVVFTGLGMVVIRADERRSKAPKQVELLLLDSSEHEDAGEEKTNGGGHAHHPGDDAQHHVHVPKVSFRLADVAGPFNEDVRNACVDADGSYVVEEWIDGIDMQIAVQGGSDEFAATWAEVPTATQPTGGVPENVLDWIPDADDQFGMGPLRLPGVNLDGTPFAARIRLPGGLLTTRQLFRKVNREPELWELGVDTVPRAMAEQWVWTREGVTCLSLTFPARRYVEQGRRVRVPARTYVLDDADLRLQGDPPVVRVAVTNLPAVPRIGRGRVPEHFHFLRVVEDLAGTQPSNANFNVQPQSGGPVTAGGACPPTAKQVVM